MATRRPSSRSSSRTKTSSSRNSELRWPLCGTPGPAPSPEAWFDAVAAERVLAFARHYCTFTKAEWKGKPVKLEPWQIAILTRLFGWKRADGTRWFRRLDLWLPRKNGKSELIAIIALYMLFADGEVSPEVYLCANDKEQAGVVFNAAAAMVMAEYELSSRAAVFNSKRSKSIIVAESAGSLQAITSTPTNKDGFMPSCAIFDEIHEMRRTEFFDKMLTGSGTRRQPLTCVISTAGKDLTTVGYREYLLDKRILAGKSQINDRLVVIFEADPADDWTSEATWRKANPNFGISAKRQEFVSKVAEAREEPEKEAAFKRYFLNLWVAEASGWLRRDQWQACGGALDLAEIAKLPCWIGLDLSMRSDLTAATCVYRDDSGEEPVFYVVPHFWLPEDGIDAKQARDGVPYRTWQQLGLLTLTPGQCVDYTVVRDHILDLNTKLAVREVCYDPYNATALAAMLQEAGMTTVEIRQAHANIAPTTMEAKNLVLQRRLRHGDNPILDWNVDNVRVYSDRNGNESLSKKSSKARIDGLAAMITGLVRASVAEDGSSVYDERGVIVF